MGEWDRSTSKVTLDAIRSEHLEAIQEHIETYDLKPGLSECLMCVETISSKKKKKLFGGGIPNETIQVSIVTPKWLFIAAQGDTSDSPRVMSAQLSDVVAKDYRDDPRYRLMPDTGVVVSGMFTARMGMVGRPHTESIITLGEEPVAEEFKRKLFEAVAEAKK